MAHPLLLALALLVTLRDSFGALAAPGPLTALLAVTLPLLFAWLLVHLIIRHAGIAIDRSGSRSALARAEAAARGLTAVLYAHAAVSFFYFDWLGAVRAGVGDLVWVDEALAALPFLLALVGGWYSWAPIERRLIDATLMRSLDAGEPVHAPPTPGQIVRDRARHALAIGAIIISLILAWAETAVVLGESLYHRGVLGSADTASAAVAAAQFAVSIPVLILAPVLIRWVWDTVPITEGDLHERVTGLCARHRVRFRKILIWRTRGAMLNGAVVGIAGPLRYILLTDALIERLPDPHLDAVIAHEVAHVKRKHLPWLLGATAVAAAAGGTLVTLAPRVLPAQTLPPMSRGELDAAAVVVSVFAAFIVFGMVSRRFERQADAFAVQDGSAHAGASAVTAPAAAAMAGALERVARLNHIPAERFGYRHGSIATRARRVRALVNTPLQRVPVDATVRTIKVTTVVAAAAVVAAIVYGSVSS